MSKRKRKVRNRNVVSPPRNPLFNHPLMKKSHVHDKSHKAKRRAEKISFARDWYSQSSICFFDMNTILRIPVLKNVTISHCSPSII